MLASHFKKAKRHTSVSLLEDYTNSQQNILKFLNFPKIGFVPLHPANYPAFLSYLLKQIFINFKVKYFSFSKFNKSRL